MLKCVFETHFETFVWKKIKLQQRFASKFKEKHAVMMLCFVRKQISMPLVTESVFLINNVASFWVMKV